MSFFSWRRFSPSYSQLASRPFWKVFPRERKMQKISEFVRRKWVAIFVLTFLAYAVWGNHGQKNIDTYTKNGVIIALAVDDNSLNAIGTALKQNHWRHDGRCDGNCFQLIVLFDEESEVYAILNARDDSVIEYLSSPIEVLRWLGVTQGRTIPM
ncbi:MAG: hypothetical protein WBO66_01815 [Candidatus Moraniibacteriota bacterium]